MQRLRIPIIILGGSDRRPAELPASGRDKHPLSGYKGVDVILDGRPLIETIVERLESVGCFGPIHIVGPAGVYAGVRGSAELIDSDGAIGENIRTALEAVRRRHPGLPIGFITCDIVPEVETLRRLMADFERLAPCDLWYPLIRAPRDQQGLGASAWKPIYRVLYGDEADPVQVLPGHLAVVDPGALRLNFVYRLVQLGYRTRNRGHDVRRSVMIRGVIFELLLQDLLHLFRLRAPTLTWSVLRTALPAARRLYDGTISLGEVEAAVRRVFVTGRHRRKYPDRRVQMPIVEALSLALDIDTEEEARAMGGEFGSSNAG